MGQPVYKLIPYNYQVIIAGLAKSADPTGHSHVGPAENLTLMDRMSSSYLAHNAHVFIIIIETQLLVWDFFFRQSG